MKVYTLGTSFISYPESEENMSSITLIGHRGACDIAPENTLTAFNKAIENGSHFLEMDIQLSQDEIPVIFHDRTLIRTTDSVFKVFVKKQSLSELKSLDAGSWFASEYVGERIPTLAEVLQLDLKNTGLMLEIKESSNPQLVIDKVYEVLQEHPVDVPIYIGSLCPETLARLIEKKGAYPLIRIISRENIQQMLALDTEAVALETHVVKQVPIQELKKNKTIVWAWTVNSEKEMRNCVEAGVEGLITNHLSKAKDFIQRYSDV